jgi:predicted TPR repeat methyltransferase
MSDTMSSACAWTQDDITALVTSNRLDEAHQAASALCSHRPDQAGNWYLLADISARLGKTGQAITCCRRVLELRPDHAGAHLNLALALARQGKYLPACEALEKVLALDPVNFQIHISMGNLHYNFGNAEAAEAAYRHAIALHPNHAEAYCSLSNALLAQNRAGDAQACLSKALELAPRYAPAHLSQGKALQQLGQASTAINCFRKAYELQPDLLDTQLSMILTLHESGQHDEATQLSQQLAARHPQLLGAWMNHGSLLNRTAHHTKALACFQMAALIAPDHAEAHFQAGFTRMKLGDHAGAIAALQATLAINPSHDGARHFLATLRACRVPDRMSPGHVAALFDQYADRFDQHLVHTLEYQVPQHLLALVTSRLGQPAARLSILDLGCGTGLCGPLFQPYARTLTGVDLSSGMIEKARERSVYHRLVVGDLTDPLNEAGASYDLILAADVFIYLGDLAPVFSACAQALTPTGLFAFSVEESHEPDPYALQETGRYAHTIGYLHHLAAQNGLLLTHHEDCVLRINHGTPVTGRLCLVEKADSQTT